MHLFCRGSDVKYHPATIRNSKPVESSELGENPLSAAKIRQNVNSWNPYLFPMYEGIINNNFYATVPLLFF